MDWASRERVVNTADQRLFLDDGLLSSRAQRFWPTVLQVSWLF